MHQYSLALHLENLHLLKHPFYRDWMEGKLSRSCLQDYARQYYAHVDAFPRYLGAIHSQCANAEQRRLILDNLNDEEGITHGKPHPELWLQFAEGLGVDRGEVRAAEGRDAIQKVVSTFFRFGRSSLPEGLGALYAYEHQVPEIAESKITGLQERYGVNASEALAFFEAHRYADVQHREALERLLDSLSKDERAQALKAAREAATTLWDFLTDVHSRNTNAAA